MKAIIGKNSGICCFWGLNESVVGSWVPHPWSSMWVFPSILFFAKISPNITRQISFTVSSKMMKCGLCCYDCYTIFSFSLSSSCRSRCTNYPDFFMTTIETSITTLRNMRLAPASMLLPGSSPCLPHSFPLDLSQEYLVILHKISICSSWHLVFRILLWGWWGSSSNLFQTSRSTTFVLYYCSSVGSCPTKHVVFAVKKKREEHTTVPNCLTFHSHCYLFPPCSHL